MIRFYHRFIVSDLQFIFTQLAALLPVIFGLLVVKATSGDLLNFNDFYYNAMAGWVCACHRSVLSLL